MRIMGIGRPITPVEHTATSAGFSPRSSATLLHSPLASSTPWAPVHAFAFPLFATMARIFPFRRCSRLTFTQAACTRLVVNVPAETQGFVE